MKGTSGPLVLDNQHETSVSEHDAVLQPGADSGVLAGIEGACEIMQEKPLVAFLFLLRDDAA